MTAPTLTGFMPVVLFGENSVNAAPQLLDADVTFLDAEGDFDGGKLILGGLLAEDRIAVRNQGAGAGQIGVSGSDITYGGVVIGSFTGGVGNVFTVTFNADATTAAIDALIQNLTYANVSDTPTANRALTINIIDAAGGDLVTGNSTFTEVTGAANPFTGMTFMTDIVPSVIDFDDDGDADLLVGNYQGEPRALRNNGDGSFTQVSGTDHPLDGETFSIKMSMAAVDIDDDGDDDLVVGMIEGTLRVFRNDGGGVFTERTGTDNPFDGVDIGADSVPSFVDTDNDGDIDAVIGTYEGTFVTYLNNGSGAFTLAPANPFEGLDVGSIAGPSFLDFDNDGDMDALFGDGGGTIRAFRNNGNATFTELTGASNPFAGVDVGTRAKLSYHDIDGDGDLDAVIGSSSGMLRVFLNQAPAMTINIGVLAEDEDAPLTLDRIASSPVAEGGTGTVNAADLHFTHDSLPATAITYTLTLATHGTLLLNGNPLALNDSFTQDDIDSGRVTFTHDGSESGGGFTFDVSDGQGATVTGQTLTFDVAAVNDAPVIHFLDGNTVEFYEGTGSYYLTYWNEYPSYAVLVTDPDTTNFDGATLTIRLTTNKVATEDGLTFFTGASGYTASNNNLFYNGVHVGTYTTGGAGLDRYFTFNANATAAALSALIDYTGYYNLNTVNPSTATRTVEYILTDGDGGTTTVRVQVQVIPTNDGPLVQAVNTGAGLFVGDTHILTPAELRFTDVDGPASSITYTITTATTHGVLQLSGVTLGVNSTFTQADIGAGRITYVHDGSAAGSDSFGFSLAEPAGSTLTGQNFTLSVTVNQAPVLANLQGDSMTYVEGASYVLVDFQNGPETLATATDTEGNFNGGTLTIRVSGNKVATEDQFGVLVDGLNGISISSGIVSVGGVAIAQRISGSLGQDLVFNLGANATPARISVLLQNIIYRNANTDNPSEATRTVEYILTDSKGATAAATSQMIVVGVNDPLTAGTNNGVTLNEGASHTITTADLAYNDADSAASEIIYTVDTLPAHGALELDGVVLDTGDTFTQDDLANNRLVYRHDGSETIADSFGFSVTDGAGSFTAQNFTIAVTPVNDPAAPVGDTATVAENGTVSIDILANDGDAEGDGYALFEVDGTVLTVGVAHTLTSGATVTLEADGTLTYNPNGKFAYLVPDALGTGAVNTAANDRFTYSLTGGERATVTVTINGVQSAGDQLWGDGSGNSITGTPNSDLFMLAEGGVDSVDGGGGIDSFYMGAALTPGHNINGGASNDIVGLQGDYAAYTFSDTNLIGIETLILMSGSLTQYSGGPGTDRYDYDLTLVDDNVLPGQTFVVHATTLLAGESLRFDGSAETNGSFFFYGGSGDDTLIGGAGNDIFSSALGQDTLTGGGGNDLFYYRFATESPVDARDAITDFGAGDHITVFGLGEPSGRGISFIGDGDFTGVGGQLRVTGSGTTWLVEVDVDGDGDADFALDVTTTADGYAWGASDFIF